MTQNPTPNDTNATVIPMAVKELKIMQHPYQKHDGQPVLQVWIKGDTWSMYTESTDAEVLTRIHEIADAMEAVK